LQERTTVDSKLILISGKSKSDIFDAYKAFKA